MAKKRSTTLIGTKIKTDECVIPPALPKTELNKLLFRQSEIEAQRIREYIEWQTHGEEAVLHVEKVASERVFARFDQHAVLHCLPPITFSASQPPMASIICAFLCRPLKRAWGIDDGVIRGWRPDTSGLTPGYYLSRLRRDHRILTNPCTL